MLMVPLTSTQAETLDGNQIFNEAVQAVKERDYTRALNLFEKQATNAKHDAQYNMAVLLQAGKGRPRNYSTALYWSWLAKLSLHRHNQICLTNQRHIDLGRSQYIFLVHTCCALQSKNHLGIRRSL